MGASNALLPIPPLRHLVPNTALSHHRVHNPQEAANYYNYIQVPQRRTTGSHILLVTHPQQQTVSSTKASHRPSPNPIISLSSPTMSPPHPGNPTDPEMEMPDPYPYLFLYHNPWFEQAQKLCPPTAAHPTVNAPEKATKEKNQHNRVQDVATGDARMCLRSACRGRCVGRA